MKVESPKHAPYLGRSPWLDQFPKSRIRGYPKHRGNLDVDVAIIGGGLTGCAVAYAFAAAGITIALFEADRIGPRVERSLVRLD